MSEEHQDLRDVYFGQRLDAVGARLEQRLDIIGQRISESSGEIHQRIDQMARDLPIQIEKAVSKAVAPLVPKEKRWWERRPWDVIVILTAVWLFVVSTGAAVALGLMPDGMLERLFDVAVNYGRATPATDEGGILRSLGEIVTEAEAGQ